MMINIRKQHLVIAVAGAVTAGTFTAHAADFSANATLQNTLTVVSVLDFDIGTVFATATGAALANGVGALVISPEGIVSDPADSATVSLTSLTNPVAAQGSVAMTADFSLTLPDTSTIDAADLKLTPARLLSILLMAPEMQPSSFTKVLTLQYQAYGSCTLQLVM